MKMPRDEDKVKEKENAHKYIEYLSNKGFLEKARKVTFNDFDPHEKQALSFINENYKEIFDGKGKYIPSKLSFAIDISIPKSRSIFSNLKKKWAFNKIMRGQKVYLAGINKNIKIPPFKKQISFKICRSPNSQQTYHELRNHFPYVFAEVCFAAFYNFDLIKHKLNDEERRWFFTRRLDFVGCNEDFEVCLAVEYNGLYHFEADSESLPIRQFKNKICNMIGIMYLEINSWKEIASKIGDILS